MSTLVSIRILPTDVLPCFNSLIEEHLNQITEEVPSIKLLNVQLLVHLFEQDFIKSEEPGFGTEILGMGVDIPNYIPIRYPFNITSEQNSYLICEVYKPDVKLWHFLRSTSNKWFLSLYTNHTWHYTQVTEELLRQKISFVIDYSKSDHPLIATNNKGKNIQKILKK
jgi:hypothetical protein